MGKPISPINTFSITTVPELGFDPRSRRIIAMRADGTIRVFGMTPSEMNDFFSELVQGHHPPYQFSMVTKPSLIWASGGEKERYTPKKEAIDKALEEVAVTEPVIEPEEEEPPAEPRRKRGRPKKTA